ncbi:MAG: hypothetical protein ACOYMA_11645 [Bacteroidia bacterium]
MKINYNTNILTIVIFFAILFTACSKEEIKSDYRDIYIGNYTFYILHGYPVFMPDKGYFRTIDTNYTYNGSIKKSNNTNKIIVDWGKETILSVPPIAYTQKSELTIDSNGNLSYPEYPTWANHRFMEPAFIKGDTIKFIITAGGNPTLFEWKVTGIKKK